VKTVSNAPLVFRIARKMCRSRMLGGGFFMRCLQRFGLLDVFVEYAIGPVKLGVPLNRIRWDFTDVATYESKLLQAFANALASSRDVTFFDCGADIGTFSTLLWSRTSKLSRIIAFEPNPEVTEFLRSNLSRLPVKCDLFSKAVSNFEGRGRLERPPYNLEDHASFLVPGDGPIEVATIDGINVRGGDVAIKIDVEGGELDVLQGAAKTIASARRCVIAMEANPDVVERTGRDTIECLRLLESIREFHFVIAETGEIPSLRGAVLKEGQSELWNLVAWTD
jgi:FkbM family methyltransferase